MADQIIDQRDSVVTSPDGAVRQQTVATSAHAGGGVVAARIVNFITGLIVSLLALRVLLALLGANQANAFASLIYGLTYPLVAPFFGLFGYTMQYGTSRFEFETLVAMVVYALIGYGISRLMSIRQADAV